MKGLMKMELFLLILPAILVLICVHRMPKKDRDELLKKMNTLPEAKPSDSLGSNDNDPCRGAKEIMIRKIFGIYK
jgi:hypothetical protein